MADMPRYYFDLKFDAESPSHDEEGTMLADIPAAEIEAVRALCDFTKEAVSSEQDLTSLAIIVRDVTGPVFEAVLNFEMKRLN
jgi:hypothetical protein